MRKMYIQPEMAISQLAAMNVVCTSIGPGGGTEGKEGGEGDAPKRQLF